MTSTGHEAPPSGASFLSQFRRVTWALNIAGTVLILLMALAVNFDVLGRDLFNHPIPGVTEFIGLSIVAVVFLQMANTLQEGRHVSNDIFVWVIADSRPRLAAGVFCAFNVIGALLMAIIVIFVWPIALESYTGGYYSGTAGVIEIPVWPFMATVVVGAAATVVQYVLEAWQCGRRAAGRIAP